MKTHSSPANTWRQAEKSFGQEARKKTVGSFLLAFFLAFSTLPSTALAQAFSPSDSPWAGLKGLIDKSFGSAGQKAKPQPGTVKKIGIPGVKSSIPEEDEESEDSDQPEPPAMGSFAGSDPALAPRRLSWSPVAESSGVSAFINAQEIVPQDGFVYTSALFEYSEDAQAPNGALYRSVIARIRVPCGRPGGKNDAMIVGSTFFSGASSASGNAKVVFESQQKISLSATPLGSKVAQAVSETSRSVCR